MVPSIEPWWREQDWADQAIEGDDGPYIERTVTLVDHPGINYISVHRA